MVEFIIKIIVFVFCLLLIYLLVRYWKFNLGVLGRWVGKIVFLFIGVLSGNLNSF